MLWLAPLNVFNPVIVLYSNFNSFFSGTLLWYNTVSLYSAPGILESQQVPLSPYGYGYGYGYAEDTLITLLDYITWSIVKVDQNTIPVTWVTRILSIEYSNVTTPGTVMNKTKQKI